MTHIFGDFIEREWHSCEQLKIDFSLMAIPMQQRWRNNGLSADFLATYLCAFFPGEDHASTQRRGMIKGAVSYIANELLENAMKFSYASSRQAVSIEMDVEADAIRLYATNTVNPAVLACFQHFIQRLLTEDTDALYMEQLTRNAAAGSGSGLGLLTMLNDYGARLAWKFTPLPQDPHTVIVTTMVCLQV
jgi:hypothetical protein